MFGVLFNQLNALIKLISLIFSVLPNCLLFALLGYVYFSYNAKLPKEDYTSYSTPSKPKTGIYETFTEKTTALSTSGSQLSHMRHDLQHVGFSNMNERPFSTYAYTVHIDDWADEIRLLSDVLRIRSEYIRMLESVRYKRKVDFKDDDFNFNIGRKSYARFIRITAERIGDEINYIIAGNDVEFSLEKVRYLKEKSVGFLFFSYTWSEVVEYERSLTQQEKEMMEMYYMTRLIEDFKRDKGQLALEDQRKSSEDNFLELGMSVGNLIIDKVKKLMKDTIRSSEKANKEALN